MEPSSTIADLLAGFISGTVSTLAVHPIDTVLTRYQATDLVSTSKTVGSVALAETRSMAATLGVMSLWRGAPAVSWKQFRFNVMNDCDLLNSFSQQKIVDWSCTIPKCMSHGRIWRGAKVVVCG